MKRRTIIKFKQLAFITTAWLLVGFFITLYDYLVLSGYYSKGPSNDYSFLFSLALNELSSLIGALLGGSFLVFFVNEKYKDKPYGYTILAVAISYILIIMIIMMTLGLIVVPQRTGKPLSDPHAFENIIIFVFDTSRIKNVLLWSVVVATTQLFLQLNSKFGYGVFWNILCGRYNTPKEEKRIFMSVDLNSSTQIAERLGDERYHELLKDYFSDITNPILDNKGEIYQYVGDEVVIAWKYEDGIANNQCVKCFFEMKNHINKKKDMYLREYGEVPAFKAGIHWGKVIVGEIGIIKRDITFSGDVLNTTSRIRNKCKEFNAEVIASSDILSLLDLTKDYIINSLGSVKLMGKGREVSLNSLLLA